MHVGGSDDAPAVYLKVKQVLKAGRSTSVEMAKTVSPAKTFQEPLTPFLSPCMSAALVNAAFEFAAG